jgi:hypothetical protein
VMCWTFDSWLNGSEAASPRPGWLHSSRALSTRPRVGLFSRITAVKYRIVPYTAGVLTGPYGKYTVRAKP